MADDATNIRAEIQKTVSLWDNMIAKINENDKLMSMIEKKWNEIDKLYTTLNEFKETLIAAAPVPAPTTIKVGEISV